jgi:uncharacterized phage protein (TIGR02218 family)
MKTVSGAFESHIAGETTSVATIYKLTRRDGTVLGFTSHDRDLVLGGVTYHTAVGDAPSEVTSSADLAVDNLEVIALIDDVRIVESELLAGLYDFATIEISEVNHQDLSQDRMILRAGVLGEQTVARGRTRVELRGVMQYLQQTIGRIHQKRCDADLGDARCKVRLAPSAWAATTGYSVRSARDANTGSVVRPSVFNDRHFKCTTAGTSGGSEPSWNTSLGGTTNDGSVVWTAIEALTVESSVATVTSRRVFSTAAISRADGWFDGGVVTWLTGLNAGLEGEVKRWTDSSNTIELHQAMPFNIAASDTFTVTAGCDLLRATCKTKFDNIYNFRGFPDMPTRDAVLAYPDSPV